MRDKPKVAECIEGEAELLDNIEREILKGNGKARRYPRMTVQVMVKEKDDKKGK